MPQQGPLHKPAARRSALAEKPRYYDGSSIVELGTFVMATRDTGYRDVSAAVAELIDNSIQANAACVHVLVQESELPVTVGSTRDLAVAVLDDGDGMTGAELRAALQFGGTNRFDDRTGLGRFGMGLPNSSVSQARRLEVYTWQHGARPLFTYLDVDEVSRGQLLSVPMPVPRDLPKWVNAAAAQSGTLVLWVRCDRLTRHRASTIVNRLVSSLGRVYRYSIWEGLQIRVNNKPVPAFDPLLCRTGPTQSRAALFGSPLRYEFVVPETGRTSSIEVRFSTLPVAELHALPTAEKRRQHIVGAAGVSIVRAGREIDYGWHLLGGKRKENYDDWWRCEIRFAPALDELFGVTHSKQGVTPTAQLRAALGPDLESIARSLNRNVREQFEQLHAAPSPAENAATASDRFLPVADASAAKALGIRYRIETSSLPGPEFFEVSQDTDELALRLNAQHPFVSDVYLSACIEQSTSHRFDLECLLLAFARAERTLRDVIPAEHLNQLRARWSDALLVFLHGRKSV